MRIAGFQSLSLIDYPAHPCAVVFTQGCPLRCAYCHNPELIPTTRNSSLNVSDIFARLDHHADTVDAVCVTGGEPTIQPDLPAFLRLLKLRGFAVKLDTNGTHPRMIESLIHDHLVDFIAMDFKHEWEGYAGIARATPTAIRQIRRTFDLLQTHDIPHEFRTTIVPAYHTEEDLEHMATCLASKTTWAWQPVRYGKTLDAHLPRLPPLPLEELRTRILAKHPSLTILIRA